jgi:integrase
MLLRGLGPVAAKKLRLVTLDDLRRYQVTRRAQVGARSVNLELRPLLHVLKENHLTAPLRDYKMLSEPVSEIGKAISEVDLARLELMASSNPNWLVAHCATVLAANTGMRSSEIKKLRLGSINLERRTLRVTRAKTRASHRTVALNLAATAAITKLMQRARCLGCFADDHYLLPADLSRHTRKTDPLHGQYGFDPTHHQESWGTAWRRLCTAAGLSIRFHDLRHTFISRAAELGTPLPVTQANVGHMSEEITKLYTHISDEAAREAVAKLDLIRNQPKFVDMFVEGSEERKPN